MEIVATGKAYWKFGGGIVPDNKLWGQVTRCELAGVVFYVRENLDSSVSFMMNAGQRWGEKNGRVSKSREILELAAPADDWETIADAVRAADPLHRPVRKNKNFTISWAESILSTCDKSI